MKLRFTSHAQYRIEEREISIEDVKLVIRKPDYQESIFGNKIIARKKLNGKTLEVIYFKSESTFVVVTIYYL